ncbi:LMBR1 domain-containing protein 2 homolog [Gryllus bimaculatus]|nr:LMBR1 domain-containing protein 2 homolog [Gryllus bimaculatus]
MNCSANVLNSTDAIKSSWHKAWISFSSDISLHLCHVVYRTSQCVAWLMMPLFFKFIKARTLIVPAKLKLAFFSNVGYCRSYFFICGILFMYFIVSPGVQINNPNFKIFTSSVNNMWGILLFVLFVGCTLAKVPRSLWNIIKCAAILHHKKYCVSKCFHPQFFSLEPSHLSSCNSKTLKIVSDWNKEHVNCHTLLKNNLRCVSSKRTLPSQNEIVGALQRYPYTEMHIRRSADEIQALENHCKQIANNYHHQCSLQQNLPGRIHEIEFWPFIQISSCSELQSPINIWTQLVTRKHFAPLVFTDFMKDQGQAFLYNTNQTAAVMLKGRTPLLEGGPLRGSYKFVQLHFHWSTDDYAGSEHTLDGKPYILGFRKLLDSKALHIHRNCRNVQNLNNREIFFAV